VAGRHCIRLSTPSSASISISPEAPCTASLNRPGLSNRLSLASSVATAIPHVGCNIRVSHPHFETQTSSPPARERWQRRRRRPRALSAASISIREGHILTRIGDDNPGFRPNVRRGFRNHSMRPQSAASGRGCYRTWDRRRRRRNLLEPVPQCSHWVDSVLLFRVSVSSSPRSSLPGPPFSPR
jgi:hypothetical protein